MRVRETVWHSSQVLTEDMDGSLLWQADIAEWREMLNWVRGWGADCEVLEPKELRVEFVREARKLSQIYQVAASQTHPDDDDFDDKRLKELLGE